MFEKIAIFIIGAFISGTIGLGFNMIGRKKIDVLSEQIRNLDRELVAVDKREQRHYEVLAEKLECGFKTMCQIIGEVTGELRGINARLQTIERQALK